MAIGSRCLDVNNSLEVVAVTSRLRIGLGSRLKGTSNKYKNSLDAHGHAHEASATKECITADNVPVGTWRLMGKGKGRGSKNRRGGLK